MAVAAESFGTTLVRRVACFSALHYISVDIVKTIRTGCHFDRPADIVVYDLLSKAASPSSMKLSRSATENIVEVMEETMSRCCF